MRSHMIFAISGLAGLFFLSEIDGTRKPDISKPGIEIDDETLKEHSGKDEIRNGDLIFQISLSEQSKAIQIATRSAYSHCGLVYKNNRGYFVLEAVQPVMYTPLDKWIARGKDGHFVVKRLKNAEQVLTGETLGKMKLVGDSFNGKDYDIYFDWSDERIYCSELVWKIYQRAAGIEIGKPEKLRDLDLSDHEVKKRLKERYGDNLPLDNTIISPARIFNSELLTTVKTN